MQSANGLGLEATRGSDYCQTTINFPRDTIPKWVKIPNHSLNILLFMKEEKKNCICDSLRCVNFDNLPVGGK